MKNASDIVKDVQRFNTLCRNVFTGGEGQELMEALERIFCDVKLYAETDRATVYAVAQRDLIIELKSHVIRELPVDIEETL